MSKIKNAKLFDSLNSVSVIDPANNFNARYIGSYDASLGFDTEPTYKPFAHEILEGGKMKFDDRYLEGNSCGYLYFKHRMLGTGKGARMTSKGHWHTKCIVSETNVNVLDASFSNAHGDLFFIAKLLPGMPIVYDNYTFSLYVIEPKLVGSELSTLALNSKKVWEWKKRLMTSGEETARAQANEIVALSMMGEAVVKSSICMDHIHTLTALLNQSQDKVLEVTGKSFEVVFDMVNLVEEQYDVGILGDETLKKGVSKFLDGQRMQVKYMDAIANNDFDGSEGMKRQIFNTALNFIGLPDMRKFLQMSEESPIQQISTPSIALASALDKINLEHISDKERTLVFKQMMGHLKSGLGSLTGKEAPSDEDINNAVVKSMHQLQTGNTMLDTEVEKE